MLINYKIGFYLGVLWNFEYIYMIWIFQIIDL